MPSMHHIFMRYLEQMKFQLELNDSWISSRSNRITGMLFDYQDEGEKYD